MVLAGVAVIGVAAAEVIHFDAAAPGAPPHGWIIAMTHNGGAASWQIVKDATAPSPPNAFAQMSQDKTAGRFPLAIWQGATIRNGDISVAFKTVSGAVDQAAGIVWRYRDPDNYYIARANALEQNVVLYRVKDGVRLSIAPKGLPSRSYGVKHEIPKNRWNILRVTFREHVFAVFLNGQRLFETEDRAFQEAGKTGLWTKADSVTYFDDFTVTGK